MDYSNEERENWPKSEKQVDNARLCSEHFVTGAKSHDPLHIDYIPTVFAFVPVAVVWRKRKSIDWYGRSQKRARNQDEKKKKKTPSNNETAIYVNVEDEHSVPDCIKQIEFEIAADKGTQTEEVIRHTLPKQKHRKIHLLKKQVKQKCSDLRITTL